MTLDEIMRAGDRVEFKTYLRECSDKELQMAWIVACKNRIQDFAALAAAEMTHRFCR